jgi:hypothetical protein
MQRLGEQIRWKLLDANKAGEARRSFASSRNFGVVYLNSLYSVPGVYPFHPRVVSRPSSRRRRQELSQELMRAVRLEGKSEPASTIQPIVLERGGGERRRAPRAEYVPAPPMMFKDGGVGGGWWISSGRLSV